MISEPARVPTLVACCLVVLRRGRARHRLRVRNRARGRSITRTHVTPRPEQLHESARAYAGGRYTLQVPTDWNGGLVLYAHCYQGEGVSGNLDNPPLSTWWLSHGYAWAASSYRSAGYRVDWFIDDMLAPRDLVIGEIGTPRWSMIEHGEQPEGDDLLAPDVSTLGLRWTLP